MATVIAGMRVKLNRVIAVSILISVMTAPPEARTQSLTLFDRAPELEGWRRDLESESEANRAAVEVLEAEVHDSRERRGALAKTLIEETSRIRELEMRLRSEEVRVGQLTDSERQLSSGLAAFQEAIGVTLAALVRLRRGIRKKEAAIQGGTLDELRRQGVVATIATTLRRDAELLIEDLRKLKNIRKTLAQRQVSLLSDQKTLKKLEKDILSLLDVRKQSEGRALTRIETLQRQTSQINQQAAVIRRVFLDRATKPPTQFSPDRTKPLRPDARISTLRGRLPRPVVGDGGWKIRSFDPSVSGIYGMLLPSHAGALVTAPADGTIVFSGPFRRFLQVIVIDAGDGYHILLAGMQFVYVEIGQFVLAGEPMAVIGVGAPALKVMKHAFRMENERDGKPGSSMVNRMTDRARQVAQQMAGRRGNGNRSQEAGSAFQRGRVAASRPGDDAPGRFRLVGNQGFSLSERPPDREPLSGKGDDAPMLYAELRRRGRSLDPSRWWASGALR